LKVGSSPPRWPATCSVAVASGVAGANSIRDIPLTAITPERPLSWFEVTRGSMPSNVSLPPLGLPLAAECTKTVPSRGGTCADTGAAASIHPAMTPTSAATLSRPDATTPRSIVNQPPLRASA
jgi:hypothetical protein